MPTRTPDPTPKPRAVTRSTDVADGAPAPRLPHERDASGDGTRAEPDAVMRQAHADVESGQVDTDRGAVTDATYRRQKKPATPPSPAARKR